MDHRDYANAYHLEMGYSRDRMDLVDIYNNHNNDQFEARKWEEVDHQVQGMGKKFNLGHR